MFQKHNERSAIGLALVLGLFMTASTAVAQTSTFTYQGRLTDGGSAANGNYDLQVSLFDGASAGTQIGATQTVSNVSVSGGVFTVTLDFGANAFTGATRFLEIGVRAVGGGSFTVLTPRQQVSSTPYAIRSANASMADTATNATQLGGVTASQYVVTSDSRLSDSRSPTAGSSNYIQNTSAQQSSANFNISGNGTAGGTLSGNIVNAAMQYNLGGDRVFSVSPSLGNTFAGLATGVANTTGNFNSFFGSLAGLSNTGGVSNSFFGSAAGKSSNGSANAFFGFSAGSSNTTGNFNSFFGSTAGGNNTASGNSFFGASAGYNNTTSTNNSFFGFEAGKSDTADQNNVVLGSYNSFFGYQAGTNNTTGYASSFFGNAAGQANTIGCCNAFFGSAAGIKNTTGQNNAFFGAGIGSNNTTGSNNTFVGNSAGQNNTNQVGNTFIGYSAGINTGVNDLAGDAAYNTFVGDRAGQDNQTGSNNTLIGRRAGIGLIGGGQNTMIGAGTASTCQGSILCTSNPVTNATAIGANAGALAENATAIGANAYVTVSNSLVLGSIKGTNGATADTNVGIGTTAPTERLTIKTATGNYGVIHTDDTVTVGSRIASAFLVPVGGWYGTKTNHPLYFFVNNSGVAMAIDTSGRVGINTVFQDQTLSVNGNASKTGGGSWATFSDERLKNLKSRFTSGLKAVMQLQPLRYEYKPNNALGLKSEGEHIGFSAQAVQKAIPEAVMKDDKGYLLINNDPIMWTMLNAIKEQQKEIEQLRKEVRRLRSVRREGRSRR